MKVDSIETRNFFYDKKIQIRDFAGFRRTYFYGIIHNLYGINDVFAVMVVIWDLICFVPSSHLR